MVIARFGVAVILLALVLAPTLSGHTAAADEPPETPFPGYPVNLKFHAEPNTSGALAYLLEAPVNLKFQMLYSHWDDTANPNPFQFTAFRENGTVWYQTRCCETTDAQWGSGYGVVYAGVGDVTVQSPDLAPGMYRTWGTGDGGNLSATRAVFVIDWENHPGTIDLDMWWLEGTTFTFLAEGSAFVKDWRDFKGGPRAGAPAAAMVAVNNELVVPAEGQDVFGRVAFSRYDVASTGKLAVEVPHQYREFDYTHVGEADGCVCGSPKWRWMWTTDGDTRITFDYAGAAPNSKVTTVFVAFPKGTLPLGVWSEARER